MLKMLIVALLLLCAGCASSETAAETESDYFMPSVYRQCMLDSCEDIPLVTEIIAPPGTSWFVPITRPASEVFVIGSGYATYSEGTWITTPIPEGAMLATLEEQGGTKAAYDPRLYDWVPLTPTIVFVGVTNISTVEVDFSVTFHAAP